MNHTMLNAGSVTSQCARYTALSGSRLRVLASIVRILNNKHAALTSTYTNGLGGYGTLTARALKGSERAATRIARSVAIVIGIALSMQTTAVGIGSTVPIQSIKQLADNQLTEKQEACHNEIVFRESSFRNDASNGSHHGYYQGKSKVLDGAPDDYQFYWFYSYTAHRYGITKYDEPNYCKSLNHLVTKGWQ